MVTHEPGSDDLEPVLVVFFAQYLHPKKTLLSRMNRVFLAKFRRVSAASIGLLMELRNLFRTFEYLKSAERAHH